MLELAVVREEEFDRVCRSMLVRICVRYLSRHCCESGTLNLFSKFSRQIKHAAILLHFVTAVKPLPCRLGGLIQPQFPACSNVLSGRSRHFEFELPSVEREAGTLGACAVATTSRRRGASVLRRRQYGDRLSVAASSTSV